MAHSSAKANIKGAVQRSKGGAPARTKGLKLQKAKAKSRSLALLGMTAQERAKERFFGPVRRPSERQHGERARGNSTGKQHRETAQGNSTVKQHRETARRDPSSVEGELRMITKKGNGARTLCA